jgi:hypothetical protein
MCVVSLAKRAARLERALSYKEVKSKLKSKLCVLALNMPLNKIVTWKGNFPSFIAND